MAKTTRVRTAENGAAMKVQPSEWRVLIVDDHQLFRNGLRALLENEPHVQICGEAVDVQDATHQFESLKPNFVTVDVSLAEGNGLDLVERFSRAEPTLPILVLSMYDEGVYADRAIAAGAAGYACKQSTNEEILSAFRAVQRGEIYLSPKVMQRLVRRTSPDERRGNSPEESRLSAREIDILGLIGLGHGTQEIARRRHISVSTVETYRERIKTKLGLGSGSELTRHAILWMMRNA